MRSEDIRQRIDVISNVLGSVGWRTEVEVMVADRIAAHIKNLLAVSRNKELDDRLRGNIEEDNWFMLMLSQRLKELKTEFASALEEEAAQAVVDNPPILDGPPKPY